MLNRLKIIFHHCLAKQAITNIAGWFANKQYGKLTSWMIKFFVKYYGIDLSEAQKTKPEEYLTFNDFFSRHLNEAARPILESENVLVFPADGVVSEFGEIVEGKLIQAKGKLFSLDALLICNSNMVKSFTNGLFVTTYLSPSDYHRVHMPCNAMLREMIYVPGSLFSVNKLTTSEIDNVFARNERVICLFETEQGPMTQILVGATIVGSIETVWHGVVNSSRDGIMKRWSYSLEGANAVRLKKGDEMGCFKMGSTVINLFAPNSIILGPQIQTGYITRVGTHLADRL